VEGAPKKLTMKSVAEASSPPDGDAVGRSGTGSGEASASRSTSASLYVVLMPSMSRGRGIGVGLLSMQERHAAGSILATSASVISGRLSKLIN
jgi:hypothetical protein